MEQNRQTYSIGVMCKFFGVSRCGYYAWRSRGRSDRDREDQLLFKEIKRIHKSSREIYGSPRVHVALKEKGFRIGKKRIERLMRSGGLKGRSARLYRKKGNQYTKAPIANNSLDVVPTRPDQVWVGDITYLKGGGRFRYCAVVMDKYSRRIIGWSISKFKDMRLTMSALNHAVYNRPKAKGVIFHSDRGAEYGAEAIQARLAELGYIQSMNRPTAKFADNAYMESFFHSMKSECIHRINFSDPESVARKVRSYIPFYNNKRKHSALGYMTPLEYEQKTA
ncbi:IS3 family transposase [Geomonas anaerohicana]|uniref:IS3 family transposase n=1 Tax=Geomonas anaerohicana TaxID=2798583 RepID=UPI002E2ABA78|nr:IS3 family transposase [Geomonas anaerohicana]